MASPPQISRLQDLRDKAAGALTPNKPLVWNGVAWTTANITLQDVSGLQFALDEKSDIGHLHGIANVVGLQTALDAKAALSHTHNAAEITAGTIAVARLGSGAANATTFLRGDGTWTAPIANDSRLEAGVAANQTLRWTGTAWAPTSRLTTDTNVQIAPAAAGSPYLLFGGSGNTTDSAIRFSAQHIYGTITSPGDIVVYPSNDLSLMSNYGDVYVGVYASEATKCTFLGRPSSLGRPAGVLNGTVAVCRPLWVQPTQRVYLSCPTTAPTDANISSGQFTFWLDEATNILTLRIRKSDGSYITKTL